MGLPVAEKGARGPEVAVCFSSDAVPVGEKTVFPPHTWLVWTLTILRWAEPVSSIVLICRHLIVHTFLLIL